MLISALISVCHATDKDYPKATNKALEAFYAQTGLELYVNTTAKDLDKKYVPEFINSNGVVALVLLKLTVQHKAEWKITFP
jgi:hypothetical protein